MRVVFHIISTGGGGGTSRTTRYIAERDKDPSREGPGDRPLFSEDRDNLTYRKADRILDPKHGEPDKDDLLHLTVSFQEEDFDKLGRDEEEKQAALREVVREGMAGMATELGVENLTWVAGIHRNTENPHAHVVIRNEAIKEGDVKQRAIGRLRTSLLPHKQMVNGQEVIAPGRIGDRFVDALDVQQEKYLHPETTQVKGREACEAAFQRNRQARHSSEQSDVTNEPSRDDKLTRQFKNSRTARSAQSLGYGGIVQSWNERSPIREHDDTDYRIALGKHLEFSLRLAFAEIWYERAVNHGDTYRFNVLDQSTNEERAISELDVHRRAAARAQRINSRDRLAREAALESDLSRHRETLDSLLEAREAKIAALRKDLGSARATVSKLEDNLTTRFITPSAKQLAPILSRQTLSELQDTTVRLNLSEKVEELEKLRPILAREYYAPTRTDDEAAKLAAQLNVARADSLTREERLEKFEASVHLMPYEVHGERWSLGAIDKEIARRTQDSRFVPDRALRLDVRSLTRFNYSTEGRERAAQDVEHLTFMRGEIVRQIDQRREPLLADRNQARDLVETLDSAYAREETIRERYGQTMPEPKYNRREMRSLEASAETLRDPVLLGAVHNWEKIEGRSNSDVDWQGRAVAREVMSGIEVKETEGRLQHFLESKRVASLNLGDHRTGTLRQVEARTLTDYLARLMETREQRDFRHSVAGAAREHHGRLVQDFEKARDYHQTASELARSAADHEPSFTDKERINLEIYAEKQVDDSLRDQYLQLARGDDDSRDLAHAASQSR
jgi:hypothetical protein